MTTRLLGAILAGGGGGRMRCKHKGLLERSAKVSLIRYTLDEMAAAGLTEVIIIANEPAPYLRFGRVIIPDLRVRQGPLAGVEAALKHVADNDLADGLALLPCDMPAITRRQIGRLSDAFREDPRGVKMAVAGEAPQRDHPLCCVVHTGVLAEVTRALDAERLKIVRLWERLGVDRVVFSDPRPFRNLNTPEEFESWRTEEIRRGGDDFLRAGPGRGG